MGHIFGDPVREFKVVESLVDSVGDEDFIIELRAAILCQLAESLVFFEWWKVFFGAVAVDKGKD